MNAVLDEWKRDTRESLIHIVSAVSCLGTDQNTDKNRSVICHIFQGYIDGLIFIMEHCLRHYQSPCFDSNSPCFAVEWTK